MVQVLNVSEDPVPLDPALPAGIVGESPREAIGGHTWSLAVPEITVGPYQALWFVGEERR